MNRQTGEITYRPYQKRKNISPPTLGLHASSSTVKSLFGLWFYLEHQAKQGDILMIDEPELNIHPSNQLIIAHLLAKLVNSGMQVVISTHSDYIVREFNNLIMLSGDLDGQLRKSFKYAEETILQAENVGAYLFDDRVIKPFNFTSGEGFAISTFDKVIESQNKTSDEIYYRLKDEDVEE